MKNTVISTCEKTFLLRALKENIRLDRRQFNEYRNVKINYGVDWGNCMVTLGDTRVLAQVSCDIQTPKASKPNEGLLFVNVDMGMAAVHYEQSRQADITVQITRMLEKCLKESKCVDLEALCIVAEEKVWNIRVDLNVMNDEGNLMGCCSIAALASLAHFRHPDVTSTGEGVIIHPASEKDPVPINLHHYPLIISYALFDSGQHILSDPMLLEEKVAESLLLLSVNSYREFCGMHLEGAPIPSSNIVIKCTKDAANVAINFVKQIKESLAKDLEKRSSETPNDGLVDSLDLNHIFAKIQKSLKITVQDGVEDEDEEKKPLPVVRMDDSDDEDMSDFEDDDVMYDEDEEFSKYSVKGVRTNTAELVPKDEPIEESSDESDGIEVVREEKPKVPEEIQLSGDSEEDEVLVLHSSYK